MFCNDSHKNRLIWQRVSYYLKQLNPQNKPGDAVWVCLSRLIILCLCHRICLFVARQSLWAGMPMVNEMMVLLISFCGSNVVALRKQQRVASWRLTGSLWSFLQRLKRLLIDTQSMTHPVWSYYCYAHQFTPLFVPFHHIHLRRSCDRMNPLNIQICA